MHRTGWRTAAVVTAVVVSVGGCAYLPTPRPTPDRPSTTTAAAETTVDPGTLPTSFGRGSYVVGVDIAPGTYVAGPGSTCYWSRSVPDAQGRGATIVEDVFDRPDDGGHRVVLAVGERFTTSRCGTWETE